MFRLGYGEEPEYKGLGMRLVTLRFQERLSWEYQSWTTVVP